MKQVILTRVSGGEALRTDTVQGQMMDPPIVGQPFRLWGPPLENLEEPAVRQVITSPIAEMLRESDHTWEFRTETGSVYKVETVHEDQV